MAKPCPGPGWRLVVCRYIVKNGVRIYPKNGPVFAFWVRE